MRYASISQSLYVLLACLLACGLMGCDTSDERSPDGTSATSGGGPTIVSLTPAITRMLIDMGKQDQLVGVSKETIK